MLKSFRSRQAQTISSEYVLVLTLAIVAVSAMSMYVKRALQAKTLDAQKRVVADATVALGHRVNMEYEPYYAQSTSDTDMYKEERTRITPMGYINKELYLQRQVEAQSLQKSPKL